MLSLDVQSGIPIYGVQTVIFSDKGLYYSPKDCLLRQIMLSHF